jgi:hypothetical protein
MLKFFLNIPYPTYWTVDEIREATKNTMIKAAKHHDVNFVGDMNLQIHSITSDLIEVHATWSVG